MRARLRIELNQEDRKNVYFRKVNSEKMPYVSGNNWRTQSVIFSMEFYEALDRVCHSDRHGRHLQHLRRFRGDRSPAEDGIGQLRRRQIRVHLVPPKTWQEHTFCSNRCSAILRQNFANQFLPVIALSRTSPFPRALSFSASTKKRLAWLRYHSCHYVVS